MSLHRVSSTSPIIINKVGQPGEKGKDGITTVITETVTVVEEGVPGKDGAVPEHQVRNGEIRFRNPDGSWGEWIQVQPARAGGGPETYNTYRLVEQANFTIQRQSLTLGMNIIGVNFNGDVTIILPNGIDKRIVIAIKDESNNAGTNNITVTTES